ncbi:hypothetical protein J2S74_003049 [Evansella vedderi]|uniref:Uncharacterized protein n=1 Tax=Evansella vedderi TaxID=38282 RepID=A0ABT9ZWQ9_9BACI|nr:hypothetical protein [Evansella vedderi]MDQ0255667.1 hypothetical protein [Evansella vedderi]
MEYKSRKESKELLTLRILNSRLKLPEESEKYYWSLGKGFAGEKLLDVHVSEKLTVDSIIINDLLIEHSNMKHK